MTKPAQNPSVQTAFNSDHIDSATLNLQGANGILLLLQVTLEPNDTTLSTAKTVGMLSTTQDLITWTAEELETDSQLNGHDWADVLVWLDGINGALTTLLGGYLGDYCLLNSSIQVSVLHSLREVISKALAYVSSYGDEGASS
jgi:hypothetical protein